MEAIELTFNDAKGTYDKQPTFTLFPLIANVFSDCAQSRESSLEIVIPFAKTEFDALFSQCMTHLREVNKPWIMQNKQLYEYLLCNVGGMDGDAETMEQYFAQIGDLPLLKLRFEIGGSFVNKRYTRWCAARGGHLDVLKWFCAKHRKVAGVYTFRAAALSGNLEMIQWLYEKDCEWDECVCAYAADEGHFDVLQWLRSSERTRGPCPWDYRTCTWAAKNGHLEILEWAYLNGCPVDKKNVLYCAAHMEKSGILRWYHEKTRWCWGPDDILDEIASGHTENVKLMMSNGCPWNKHVYKCIAKTNNLELLKWLGCASTIPEDYMFKWAARNCKDTSLLE